MASENKQEEIQKDLMNYERYRNQLMHLANQKQTAQMQIELMEAALTELGKTKETKVYKAIGNVLIYSDKNDVVKDMSKDKESVELKLKTIETQEKTLLDLLNKLKIKIEGNLPKKAKEE